MEYVELNKIYQGDILEKLDLIPDNSIDLILTSPPYNIGVKYEDYEDNLNLQEYLSWIKKIFKKFKRILKEDGRFCINILYEVNMKDKGGRVLLIAEYYKLLQEVGLHYNSIVDLKENTVSHRIKYSAWGSWLSSSSPYIYNPKECLIIGYNKQWKKKKKDKNKDIPKELFLELVKGSWLYRPETKGLTKSNFSLDIPLKAIQILSYKKDVVLDPFMGSGTTAIAAKLLDRYYIGIELSNKYCSIAEERIKKYKYEKGIIK